MGLGAPREIEMNMWNTLPSRATAKLNEYFVLLTHFIRESLLSPKISILHPCEKVIGIFFWHKFITIYSLLFALIFIHNICEMVNINSNNFCWISIVGYTSETFWKRLLGQNPVLSY